MGLFNKLFSRDAEEKQEVSQAAQGQRRPTETELNGLKDLMLGRFDAGTEAERKRKEAYIERPVQRLLRNLLETDNREIIPTYDPSHGFRFTTVESLLDGDTPQEAEALLERLFDLRILGKSFHETALTCPHCGSTSITMHHRCPKCSSHRIAKTSLTEHKPCGNIAERDQYVEGHSSPTCPKCGDQLLSGEYRDLGRWYVCRSCKDKFESADLDLICRKCTTQFAPQKAAVHEIFKYHLNPEREHEIRQNVTSMEIINDLLLDLGFSVEMPASILGTKSGIQHYFELMATKGSGSDETIITVDHATGDPEVSASQLILYVYKLSEVNVNVPVFVATPKLSDTAKRIAEGYNVLVVDGIPQGTREVAALQDEIKKRLSV
jgi:predicted RNA-binding Zn-ribbon protein involved in translation (DUF1610 family)